MKYFNFTPLNIYVFLDLLPGPGGNKWLQSIPPVSIPGKPPLQHIHEHRAACCQGMRLVPPYMCFPSHPPPSPQGSRLRRAAGTLSHSLEVGILSETLPEGRGRPACPR
uniref:Uncharacterized protein n=1 Tax=Anas platyrhynchos platyrhynchos TaxID=8840 RepID=A0A493T4X5_ANAPP